MDLVVFTSYFFEGLARFVAELKNAAGDNGRISLDVNFLVRDLLDIYLTALQKVERDAVKGKRIRGNG